jgi:queuosine precursor transporter
MNTGHTPPCPRITWPLPHWTPQLAVATCGTAYALVLAGANLLTPTLGMPTGFGLTVAAGTYSAGLAGAVRDTLHDLAGAPIVLLVFVVAATVSALTADPRIVLASTMAAVASELADLAVYTQLRRRSRPLVAAISGLVGALVDSVSFICLAGFPVTTRAIAGQLLLVKAVWVTAAYLLMREALRRVVPRQRQHAHRGLMALPNAIAGT